MSRWHFRARSSILAGMKDSKVIVAINKDERARSSRSPITDWSRISFRDARTEQELGRSALTRPISGIR